ncbi:MAG: plastocyanin [Magnetococcales bacterium]|nr:cupredoxin domain-containing protein [Magnetococcales bacterium]NGZ07238.1 plastocyanin [Magnetococcales bacterium]
MYTISKPVTMALLLTLFPMFPIASASASTSASASAAPTEATVTIEKMTFHPNSLTIPTGTTVTWKNNENGATYHAIASDQPELFQSPDFFPGETWKFTFTQPGTYPYHCTPHANRMKGTIIVK